jgi:hypothetical protein
MLLLNKLPIDIQYFILNILLEESTKDTVLWCKMKLVNKFCKCTIESYKNQLCFSVKLFFHENNQSFVRVNNNILAFPETGLQPINFYGTTPKLCWFLQMDWNKYTIIRININDNWEIHLNIGNDTNEIPNGECSLVIWRLNSKCPIDMAYIYWNGLHGSDPVLDLADYHEMNYGYKMPDILYHITRELYCMFYRKKKMVRSHSASYISMASLGDGVIS